MTMAVHKQPFGEVAVIAALGRVHSLPALPAVVRTVTRRIVSESAGPAEIARLLSHDQALTARVLRLANSAFYAPREPVRSVNQAVVLLGFGTVRAIVLKASIFSAFDLARARPFWLHALGTACAARAVARLANLGRGDDAFVMGLLHDIGKLALAEHLPEPYAEVRALVAREGGLIRDAEQRVLGCDHAAIGRFLCEHWSLPADCREAIAFHHHVSGASEANRPWAACVHVADIVARALLVGNGGDDAIPFLDPTALPMLGLGEDRYAALFAAAEQELARAEVFFTVLDG
jgi:HD-like signal output (HDOD) protein